MPLNGHMVTAVLNTTGEARIPDDRGFAMAVLGVMAEYYGCAIPDKIETARPRRPGA